MTMFASRTLAISLVFGCSHPTPAADETQRLPSAALERASVRVGTAAPVVDAGAPLDAHPIADAAADAAPVIADALLPGSDAGRPVRTPTPTPTPKLPLH